MAAALISPETKGKVFASEGNAIERRVEQRHYRSRIGSSSEHPVGIPACATGWPLSMRQRARYCGASSPFPHPANAFRSSVAPGARHETSAPRFSARGGAAGSPAPYRYRPGDFPARERIAVRKIQGA
jgi:hypothetical protein